MFIEILSHLYSWMQSPWYWLVAFVVWYLFYGVECAINGSEGGFLMPFREFAKDFTWSIPGGLQRRVLYFRENVMPSLSSFDGKLHGCICGTISWDYDWVAENNLYEDCAKDTLPGPFHFWFMVVLCPILWPVSLTALIALFAISIPLSLLEPVLEPLFGKYFGRYFDWREERYKTKLERKITARST